MTSSSIMYLIVLVVVHIAIVHDCLLFYYNSKCVSLTTCFNRHAYIAMYTFPSDVEVSGKFDSGNNSTSDHTVVVDPDQLIGPQVIDMIMNKPGMI